MTAMWRFRPSRSQDAEQMYDVWHDAVRATHDFLRDGDFAEISVLVRRDYLPNYAFTVAVDANDRVVGFMGMTDHHIDSLFIDPTCHAKGLGRAFIAEAASRANVLEVEVNAQNLRALGFYEALGFAAYASSPVDDGGRPYPILKMRLMTPARMRKS